ncbi:MAG: hypothetical protein ACP5KY_07335 [Thermoproteus sp.]
MRRISARYSREGLFVEGKKIPEGFSPIELLAAAVAYGVGSKYMDAGLGGYEIECLVEGDEVRCRGRCTGVEERCLVFRLLRRAVAFECV